MLTKEQLKTFIAFLTILIVFIIVIYALCGCHDNCKINTERCHNNRVEVCDGDRDWGLVMNCDKVEPGEWICCYLESEDIFACLPINECTN